MTKEIMDYERCRKEFIRKVDVDKEKIKSMIKMANIEQGLIAEVKLDSNSASKLVKDYYEIIKELLIALMLSCGLKSDNHECLISFFHTKYPNYEFEANAMHDLKNVRNRVSYDGYFVDEDYIKKNKLEFNHIIDLLKKLIDDVPNMGQ